MFDFEKSKGRAINMTSQMETDEMIVFNKNEDKICNFLENKNVAVWDCTFYVTDDEGNELLNDDGTIKIFDIPNMDWSYVSEFIEFEDLEERKNEKNNTRA